MSQEQFTNRSDSSSNQNLDKKDKDFGVNTNKVGAIRTYSAGIMNSRKDLENYLLKKGIKLVTSFSDFVNTNSFIQSSYIIYVEQEGNMEKLQDFVTRNIQFKEIVDNIELELKK